VHRYSPGLVKLVFNGKINRGKVFDLALPLDLIAEGYRAMDAPRNKSALAHGCDKVRRIHDEHGENSPFECGGPSAEPDGRRRSQQRFD